LPEALQTRDRNGFLQTLQVSAYAAEADKTDRLVLANGKWHHVTDTGEQLAIDSRVPHRIDEHLRRCPDDARSRDSNHQVQMQRRPEVSRLL